MSNITPINYRIHLEPDLNSFRFSGSTQIRMQATTPVREITLNTLELAVWNCRVKVNDRLEECPFSIRPDKEEITISLPEEKQGQIMLKIDYMGQINDRMAGFYRSRYGADGEIRYIAVTQFEESDARRAFPCFDHPVMKATFELEMIIEKNLVAISNGPVVEERKLGKGKKLVRFQKTPKMSTYLVFFSVGEYRFIEEAGHILLRAATMPGMTKYAGFGLDFGLKSLHFCEQYYDIKYPLPKLDLIAIPDFAFGAMENWGAITFRENLLLHYPGITSRAGEERICEIIAHEIAHQWFGNLVTPSEWKYLWLNESFATYFGYGVVGHYHPEWDVWEQFMHSQTGTALVRDALLETFSIEIPGGEHVIINTSTAPIIYNKGGSILRQIEGYIGSHAFRAGLRNYLKNHEYDCASSHHLWEALEEVSEKPVSQIMKSWIEQPGFPIVEVKREGDKLILRQKRFTYLPDESDQTWLVPVTVRVFFDTGGSRTIKTLLSGKEGSIDIGRNVASYKLNDRQTGFYRTWYRDKNDFFALSNLVSDKTLSPEDRWGLQNDFYALVRSGHVPLDDYLELLTQYHDEDRFLPFISIADNLFQSYLVTQGAARERVSRVGRSLFERAFTKMGLKPDPGEKHTTAVLRDQIILHAVLYKSREAEEFALAEFESLMHGREIHPDIMKSAMQVGALNGDDRMFDWFDRRLKSSDSEHERINLLIAMGKFRDMDLIARAQQYALDDVPDRNKFVLIGSLSSNPKAIPLMWDWYTSRLSELEEMHPIHYERVIGSIVPFCGLGREKEVRAFFEDYMSRKKKARDVIKLSLEKMEVNSRMRKGR